MNKIVQELVTEQAEKKNKEGEEKGVFLKFKFHISML